MCPPRTRAPGAGCVHSQAGDIERSPYWWSLRYCWFPLTEKENRLWTVTLPLCLTIVSAGSRWLFCVSVCS
jgi:hypothetical protein